MGVVEFGRKFTVAEVPPLWNCTAGFVKFAGRPPAFGVNDSVTVPVSAEGNACESAICGAGWSAGVFGCVTENENEGSGITVIGITVAFAPLTLSCTRTVNWNEPAVVGVPESTPLELRFRPGTEPAATVHVNGGDPPAAVNVCEYGTLTIAGGSVAGPVIVSTVPAFTVCVTTADELPE